MSTRYALWSDATTKNMVLSLDLIQTCLTLKILNWQSHMWNWREMIKGIDKLTTSLRSTESVRRSSTLAAAHSSMARLRTMPLAFAIQLAMHDWRNRSRNVTGWRLSWRWKCRWIGWSTSFENTSTRDLWRKMNASIWAHGFNSVSSLIVHQCCYIINGNDWQDAWDQLVDRLQWQYSATSPENTITALSAISIQTWLDPCLESSWIPKMA